MDAKEIRLDELNTLGKWAANLQSQSARQTIAGYIIDRVKELTGQEPEFIPEDSDGCAKNK